MAIHGYPGGIISATAPTTSPTSASGVWTLDDQLQAGANWPVAPSFVSNSVRLRSSASAYLSRTPSVAGNRKTWTFSAWVKRGTLGTAQGIFGAGSYANGTQGFQIAFQADNTLRVFEAVWGSATVFLGDSVAVYRDPSAWYHIVVTFDTTQATSTNRLRVYVNGQQITLTNYTAPALNTDYSVNGTSEHTISRAPNGSGGSSIYFDGYLADVNFIDGQALTPNYFGAVDPATGVWEPATYRGSYGTNGFYLPFVPASASFSGSFNGTNQFLSVAQNAAFSFGTGDFTVEAFVNANSWNSVNPIIALGDGAVGGGSPVYSGWVMRYDSSNGIVWYRNDTGGETSLVSGATLQTGQWNHIAISKSSGTLRMFANGQQVYSAANTTNYDAVNSNTLKIGGNWVIGGGVVTWVNGAISNVRIVKGTGLYTASFTPPTAALTAVSGTSLLTLQNSSIVDNSPNAFSITNNNSVTTSSANPFTSSVGLDASGNGNNWTANNISLSSGATYDSMTDVPTLTSATQANYPVLNPLANGSATLSNGNLSVSGGNDLPCTMVCPPSGHWYVEFSKSNATAAAHLGIYDATSTPATINKAILYAENGGVFVNNSQVTTFASYANGDIISMGVDIDTGNLYFSKNNVYQGSVGIASSGISLSNVVIGVRCNTGVTANINFGQRPFTYPPTLPVRALNTFNLPTPTIGATASTQANKYMDVSLWDGNSSTNNIVNSGAMQPSFVWIKRRDLSASNVLFDAVRGRANALVSNAANAEVTTTSPTSDLVSFNSNGFTLGPQENWNLNNVGSWYVGWQWNAGTSTVTNTAGSITSTVSANTSSGFSIVTYTGNGTNGATVGHGLGVAPKMVIVKSRSLAEAWPVNIGNITGVTNDTLWLNQTSAKSVQTTRWQGNPSSTVFFLGGGVSSDEVNKSGATYVAYCFAEVAGFSRFGSYTGNGSSDGPFVFCGFRPRYIMFKKTNSTSNWSIQDTSRSQFNATNANLYANLTTAEETGYSIDIISNGFKIRDTSGQLNTSGDSYIFMAFAESPFKYANAR